MRLITQARGQQTMGLPTQTETNLMLRTHSERSTLIILAPSISILEQGEGDVVA